MERDRRTKREAPRGRETDKRRKMLREAETGKEIR